MPELTLPAMTSAFAEHFTRAKPEFLRSTEGGCAIVQTGAALLPDPADPIAWPTELTCAEPLIETFVVDPEGNCMATGENQRIVEAWRPAVEAVAQHVLQQATLHGIEISGNSYLTASVTPADQVATLPHFDDDMLVPGEGVGLVAIVGGLGGPRVAAGSIAHRDVRAPSQLQLSEETAESLTAGTIEHNVVAGDQIVVFPQFGQLHSGPLIDDPDPTEMRYLLVFRSATNPR